MEIKANNTAILARKTIEYILKEGYRAKRVVGDWCMKKDGNAFMLETNGVHLILENPKNCITSQHSLACEIETEDYLLGLNPGFIEYSDWSFYKKFQIDGKYPYTYGERLCVPLHTLSNTMLNNRTSRQLIISIWNNISDTGHTFVPCNVLMKLEIRLDRLNMFVINRSQDVCRGIFLDTFAYPMIHQIVAKNFGLKLGKYYHYIMNAHIYEDDMDFAIRISKNIRNCDPLDITENFSVLVAEKMKEISENAFIKHNMTVANYLAKQLPEFWYNWKANQIIYAYSKFIKKDPMPTALTCVGVTIRENPVKEEK